MKESDRKDARNTAELLTDTGHTIGSSFYLLLLGLLVSIVLARYLGPEGKGSYDLLWVTAHMFSVLGGLSLSSGITFYAAQGHLGIRKLLRQLGLFTIMLCALAGALLWSVRGSSAHDLFLPPDVGGASLLAITLLIGFLTTTEHWRSFAVGLGRIPRANQRDLLREILFLALLAMVALGGSQALGIADHTGAIWAATGAYLVGSVLFFKLIRGIGAEEGKLGFRAVVGYSIPAHSSNIAQFLNYRLDFFLVSYFGGLSALGYYSIAVGLAQLLWIGSRSASRVLLPAVASSDTESGTATAIVARLSIWSAVIGAALYVLGGRHLIELLYGMEFLPSHTPLLILLVGTVPFTLANTLAAYLAGLGLPRLNFYASLVGLVATVVLDLLLIPRFGIAGAATATTVSYLASTTVIVFHFRAQSRVSLWELVVLRREDLDVALQVARGAAAALLGRIAR